MELIGKVTSLKMRKTAVVEVERITTHPLYKKRTRQKKHFKAHDELGVRVGDVVKIVSSRPLSKEKHFKIKEVIKK
jgi:small subunit ribosomal protein S17